MEKQYTIKAIYSNEADEKFINDFCFACNTAFGDGAMPKETFEKKFLANIYGPSIVCVCYDEEGNTAGARALWRNDIEGKVAYQPCDTCVLKEHRRQGLFEKMTFEALAMTEEGAIIYNYPNENSRRLYLKLGWELYGELKPRFYKKKAYALEHPEMMSDEYYNWWILGARGTENKYRKVGKKYFWVKDYGRFMQSIVAEISEKTALTMKKASRKPLLYWSEKHTWYSKKKESRFIVHKGNDKVKIPTWKMDVI